MKQAGVVPCVQWSNRELRKWQNAVRGRGPETVDMEWGSTRPGALLTGSKPWQAKVTMDWLTLSVGSEPSVAVNLVQLQSIGVSTGLMWATCHFAFQEGDKTFSRTVDGIRNGHAHEMQRAIAEATVSTLATFVTQNTPALEEWLGQVFAKLNPTSGTIVGDDEIRKALASFQPPSTPGTIPWDSILLHSQAKSARERANAWPAWDATPSVELEKRLRTHNEAAFKSAFDRWTAVIMPSIGDGRWIPKGLASKLVAQHAPPVWPGRAWKQVVGDSSPVTTLTKLFKLQNKKHLAHQRKARKTFFDTVEKYPLTDEQIHACICMDNSVMVVAAAGSGKTSTMVAKTGYVLQEGLATPDQILLLAFNRATANEVAERIAEQLSDVPNVGMVKSKTFHAFGIEVIATATGKKPSLAPWVDPEKAGSDIRKMADILQTTSELDAGFKRDWDLFRTIYARDVGKWGEHQDPDAYSGGKRGFQTAKGDIVKSKEERLIADWLFYHGVNYEYERAYEHDTADQSHRQYFPDFYYPDANLYHEHFALNAIGEAPKDFKDYLSGVAWKRNIHAEKGTAFIETTSHDLMNRQPFEKLETALQRHGIRATFDPHRKTVGLPPVPENDLIRSFRVFQQHVKNNGLTHRDLRAALKVQSLGGFAARLGIYLIIYERISAEWERRLREGKFVDFEDMLIQAAEHVESGKFKSPYTVILADEFQDCSRARIRLLKALINGSPSQPHLCVVGDDWQGINRFAGSDISVMAEFEKTFRHATRLTLNTTFRCPQALCDVSSAFIQANPAQISKIVKSTNVLTKTPILAYGFERRESIPAYIETQLAEMHRAALADKIAPSSGKHITVMLLGRYRDDEPSMLGEWNAQFGDRLKIDYKTVHGSKGLEAEYVFVLNVVQSTRGFPSQLQDDPALQLAMPAPDAFPFAEERRLFYVAMTRARKQVRFYTTLAQPSQFLVELVANGHLTIEPVDGEPLEACPTCRIGVVHPRQGSRGIFHGCSRFPRCDFTRSPPSRSVATTRRTQGPSVRIRVPIKAGDPCPVCRRGLIQQRNGRNGPFLGCTKYPACRATAVVPTR